MVVTQDVKKVESIMTCCTCIQVERHTQLRDSSGLQAGVHRPISS